MLPLWSACASAPAPAPAPVPAPVVLPAGPFERELAPGLVLSAHAPAPLPPVDPPYASVPGLTVADPRLWVVRVDPARWDVGVWSTLDPAVGTRSATVPELADRFDLAVAFNVGMFEPDDRPTGYTRAGALALQPRARRNPMYGAWFVAGPGVDVLHLVPPQGPEPYVDLGPLAATLAPFRLVSQSLTVVRDGAAVYPPRDKLWSEVAYGVDARGWLAVVFSRTPYEMREFGARAAQLGITDLLHAEGGPEATLVVRAGGVDVTLVGSFETGFADDSNETPWPVPSVVGVRPTGR